MSRAFPKPVVVVSKCLEFEACRYNGERISSSFIERLKPHVRFRPVCPEVEIGLGTPRDPIRIYVKGEHKALYQPSTRKHLTRKMNAFSKGYLAGLEEVDGFILKAKSPSCAIDDAKIFPTAASANHTTFGAGLFAGAALERFGARAFADEAGLNEPDARSTFLTKIFTLAGFREVKMQGSMNGLVRYHAENKLLFMAYDQSTMRELGRIAANHEKHAFGEAAARYEDAFLRLLARTPSRASYVNALTHALGHLSEKISGEEKMRFLGALEEYRAGKIPLGAPLDMLREWTTRFGSEYLEKQTLFEPYPGVLGVNRDQCGAVEKPRFWTGVLAAHAAWGKKPDRRVRPL